MLCIASLDSSSPSRSSESESFNFFFASGLLVVLYCVLDFGFESLDFVRWVYVKFGFDWILSTYFIVEINFFFLVTNKLFQKKKLHYFILFFKI